MAPAKPTIRTRKFMTNRLLKRKQMVRTDLHSGSTAAFRIGAAFTSRSCLAGFVSSRRRPSLRGAVALHGGGQWTCFRLGDRQREAWCWGGISIRGRHSLCASDAPDVRRCPTCTSVTLGVGRVSLAGCADPGCCQHAPVSVLCHVTFGRSPYLRLLVARTHMGYDVISPFCRLRWRGLTSP